jgi:tellurite methyltransferase
MNKATVSERDNGYWDEYYAKSNVPDNPSSFAQLVIDKIDATKTLVELGCGNGRDSFFFGRNHIHTMALDLSQAAIDHNASFKHENVEFKVADFTKLENDFAANIGSIYSRFTLHSIDHESYLSTLDWCAASLKDGGKLYLEARTTNDPLFGQGEKVGHNEFVTTHYRRFMEIKEVMADLEKRGFELIYATENYLDSWYKDDHAVVFRIIGRK